MCFDPLSIAAMVATVAGSALQAKGNQQAVKARRNEVNAEALRQNKIRDEQAALFAKTLTGFDQGQQTARRTSMEAPAASAIEGAAASDGGVDVEAGLEASAPKVIKGAAAKGLLDSLTRARTEGRQLAHLRSFGDLFQDNAIDLNQSAIGQQQLAGFSQGSNSVLPLELEAANQKGAGLRGFGQFLQGAGQAAGFAGAMGAGPGWGDIFGKKLPVGGVHGPLIP